MSDLLSDHEILVGTYEEHVLGFGFSPSSSSKLTVTFTDHAHSGTVRSVAAGGKFLLTSGVDENVKIFNLRNRREHGSLHHSDGTVNHMTFYDERNVVTAGDDNKICILKTSTWRVEKTLSKHQAGVTHVSIHPSGKMALSVGKDHKLITWNLIKGRSAYVTNLGENAEFVRWSGPEGTHYAVGFHRRVDVYAVGTASVVYTIPLKGRANAVAFLDDDDTFLVAGEMAEVEVHGVKAKKLLHRFEAHEKRVRCLEVVVGKDGGFAVVTASNDGFVKVWKGARKEDVFQISLVASHDTKCRITCMAVHRVPEVKAVEEAKKTPKKMMEEVVRKRKKVVTMVEPKKEEKGGDDKRPKLVVEIDDDDDDEGEKKKSKKKRRKKATASKVSA